MAHMMSSSSSSTLLLETPPPHTVKETQLTALPSSPHVSRAAPTVGLPAQRGLGTQSGCRSRLQAPNPQRPAGPREGTQLLNELSARCSLPVGVWGNNAILGPPLTSVMLRADCALPVVQGTF